LSIYRPEQDWPRFVPVDKIFVSIYDRKLGQTYGEVSDISSSGACIAADREYEADSTVLLRLSLHDQPDAFIIQAQVVWCRAEENNGHAYAYGVKFCITEDEQQKTLESILKGSELKLANRTNGEGKEPTNGDSPKVKSRKAAERDVDDILSELAEDLDLQS
jgi:Tfp pilus assembly protein PilZ